MGPSWVQNLLAEMLATVSGRELMILRQFGLANIVANRKVSTKHLQVYYAEIKIARMRILC
jgi:hypothetical protein